MRKMPALLREHWREYLMEAWGLGMFMLSACVFGVLLFHTASPLNGLGFFLRNLLMGVAMGVTAVAIICSPWGKRSGAHINPAVTLTFLRLGKINPGDAFFYILAQFAGGAGGVLLAWTVLGRTLEDTAVNFVVTLPGKDGAAVAFVAEMLISFGLMLMVLVSANSPKWSRRTPFLAGLLVAFYITFESPLSGMSMNPARTFGSAAVAGVWTDWWIYFTAPPAAMLLAAEFYVRVRGWKKVYCAKFHHHNAAPCIFNCRFEEM